LTIHIRSGDIFSNDIHPSYGQPPLAFYIKALSHYNPEFVILVFEDMSNPVIQALISYLESKSVDYTIKSSLHLRDDIKVLVAAKALVMGRGTFMWGVLCFNCAIETLYTFGEQALDAVLPQEPGRRISHYIAEDNTGQYNRSVMQNNWQNSEDQRRLMLSYPVSKLVLRKHCSK
jgi:hypothetical protein